MGQAMRNIPVRATPAMIPQVNWFEADRRAKAEAEGIVRWCRPQIPAKPNKANVEDALRYAAETAYMRALIEAGAIYTPPAARGGGR